AGTAVMTSWNPYFVSQKALLCGAGANAVRWHPGDYPAKQAIPIPYESLLIHMMNERSMCPFAEH
ncbi:hypothetical protein NK913_24215, partial [Salmonella enterica subsp. enterica serovar Typhimurium]